MSNLPVDAAPEILDALTAEANRLLSSTLHATLEPFNVGSAGNFPYYYQMPSTLQFNGLTYNWISQHVTAGAVPTTLSNEFFTNLWIEAFTKVNFQYSTADKALLTKAYQDAQVQQTALLSGWQAAFGSLPTPDPGQTVIDKIMYTVAQTWAQPPTTMYAMQQAVDLRALLNNAPPSGLTLLPLIANFLQALSSSVSLANAGTMNNGYLATARANVQTPTATNGGLTISQNGSPVVVPAWQVNTPLADIVNGLAASSNAATITMSVKQASASEFSVSVNGGTSFTIPFDWFFSLSVGASASYFSQTIVASSTDVEISMSFPGVTLVNLGPTPMNLSTKLNWFWTQPIINAIKTGTDDKTDFKFSPDPQIDFTHAGGFGYPTALAISSYPTISIKVTSSSYDKIATTLQTATSVRGTFLGIPLFSGSSSTYSHNEKVDAQSKTVTITMSPPAQGMGSSVDTNVAWVLGAQTTFPAATASANAPRARAAFAARSNRRVARK